ncbi:MAG: biopolymer transporter ExbD [Acidobacteriia bacterium]|nr:biopolymer transporter ExbD [Terriglobia bacterium]
MGMAAGGNRRGTMVEVNIVPLIDVLLVLLVIFMILIPPKTAGLPAEIPQQSTEPEGIRSEPDPRIIVVEVLRDGALRVNQQAVDGEGLRDLLLRVFAQRASQAVFVKGDKEIEFAQVARVIDVIRGSGGERVGLLTPEQQQER